jgi:hypothetical protein
MARSMTTPARARPEAPEQAEEPQGREEPAAGPLSKFTVLLDDEEAASFDQLALTVRRKLGRRVTKGDLVRALVAIADDDSTVRELVVEDLRKRPPRRRDGRTA